jgi:hypothetical protein
MWFGCNVHHYHEVAAQVPGMTMVRVFLGDPVNRWPATPRGTAAFVSIRPDPTALLKGSFDHVLHTMLRSAPHGSYLTAWHEADKGRSHGGLSASHTRDVHTYMHRLARRANHHVKYGAVVTQGIGRTDLGRWVVHGLDFYGVDVYDLGGKVDPGGALHHAFRQLPNGRRVVAESNSAAVAHRPAWFREIYDWLAVNRGHALLTFWEPGAGLSGAWVNDPATIYALNGIAADAKQGNRV